MLAEPMTPPDRPAPPAPDLDALFEAFAVQNPNGYWQHTLYHEASDPVAMPDSVVRVVVMRADAITTLRAQKATAEARVAALEAALMAIRGKASELVEFYASGVSKEIANLADAALKGGAAT